MCDALSPLHRRNGTDAEASSIERPSLRRFDPGKPRGNPYAIRVPHQRCAGRDEETGMRGFDKGPSARHDVGKYPRLDGAR
jgi:hypothetical protein